MPGEWLTQGGIFPGADPRKKFGLGLKWPRKLGPIPVRGAWLQAGGFLMVGLFSAVTLTTPRLTGWVLLGILALAFALCAGFRESALSATTCAPSAALPGCMPRPRRWKCAWMTAPFAPPIPKRPATRAARGACISPPLQDNSPCGLCMECVRVCPNDNVSVNLRAFGDDLVHSRRTPRLDETFWRW